jgi:hypothetical protein
MDPRFVALEVASAGLFSRFSSGLNLAQVVTSCIPVRPAIRSLSTGTVDDQAA